MLRFLISRILSGLFILLGMSVITFIIIQLPPGDFADKIAGNAMTLGGASAEAAQRIANQFREQAGLNLPLYHQYWRWISNIIFHFNFGQSFFYNKDVASLLSERLPRTFFLALTAHLISTVGGCFIGIYAAMNKDKLGDRLSTLLAFLGMTLPRFIMTLLIIYWVTFILDAGGTIGSLYSIQYTMAPWSFAKFIDLCKHVWPIILIAGIGGLAYNMRMMRNSLLEVMHSQYIETAISKGLSRRRVIYHHAVPNALHPIVAQQGTILPYMIQGEIEVATILGIPTIGPLIIASVNSQDIYVSASIMLMLAALLIVGNIISDILLAKLDPRIILS